VISEQRNIRVTIEYDGSAYHGWQSQKNATTVQDSIESALFNLTGENIRIIGSGRTDTGVHARAQVANFVLRKLLTLDEIENGLNAHLPLDIVIKNVELVPMDFNARFDAKKRVYQYFILPEKTALHRNFCWQIFYPFEWADSSFYPDTVRIDKIKPEFSGFSFFDKDIPIRKVPMENSTFMAER